MHHQNIGILGGMGPAEGLYFAQKLIALNTHARMDAEHVPFILYSNPQIPSRSTSRSNRGQTTIFGPNPPVISSLMMQ